ncbi:hypothetical protein GOP47_0025191 [Adiantum capillus-veneris]|uniref:Protein PHLOEM PROTEIN 2-LIKE A10 n=1 Tax=Adiantum capillus-veneris TaxID=13818 RepID=A0A9D4U379_ADICA|nr:hypothetical protein GOP47_0025191 [Adiantum capillus-veneris]
MPLFNSRRRKLLFAAAVLVGSGYASYNIYRSAAFTQRRKCLLHILSTLGFCCEALSQSAESLSILAGDLKSFLLSDDETVPQSLKQAFKIGQSEEFQESVTVLSAALARGLQRGINAKPRKEDLVHGHGHGHCQFIKQGWQGNDTDFESEEVACREIREVSFTTIGQDQTRMHGLKECMSRSRAEKGGNDWQDWEVKSYSNGSDMHAQHSQKVGIVFDRIKKPKTSEDLLERLVSKLFSEPGVGFASAISGTFARSLVLTLFDVSRNQISSSKKDPGSKNHQCTTFQIDKGSVPIYAKVIAVLHRDPCKTMLAECMRTFIGTAVTVYVDKTKDVNFCDEVVASITNTSHKDSMKEMLTTICNGAIETLVRTSYDALRERQGDATEGHEQAARSKWDIQQCSSVMAINGQLPCSTKVDQGEVDDSERGALPTYSQSDSQSSLCTITRGVLQGKNVEGAQSFIDGVSKALAIPSNHKLIVDMAGTMTSEAVRSFVNVVVSTASSQFNSKLQGSWSMLRDYISNYRSLQLQERSRDMAAKAFVFASVCLAICLHMLTGSQLLYTYGFSLYRLET